MKRRGSSILSALSLLVPTLVSGVAYAGAVTPMPAALTFPMTGTGSQSKSMTVQFVNTSMAQIVVDAVTIGGTHPNDFVIVNPPGLPTALGPNVSLPVEVAFAPTVGGPRTAQLQAQVRGEMGTTNVSLTGTGVGPKITVTPSPILAGGMLFGQMVPPTMATVSNAGGANVTVNSMTISGPDAARFGLTGLPIFPALLTPNQSFPFNITFSPAMPGAAMATLEVKSTDPMTPVLTTPITGYSGNPKITLDLGTMIIGNQRVGQPSLGQDLNITNTGLSDLHISKIEVVGSNPGDFTFMPPIGMGITLKVGQSTKISVVFTPMSAGPRSAMLQITSDDPMTPTRTVSMSGTGTTPLAMVSPGMIDFGMVKVSATANNSVTIKNGGTGPVLVNTLALTGPDAASFTKSVVAPFTIAAGASTVVQVSFKPKAVASFKAALDYTTDDPMAKMGSVTLVGSSTSPTFGLSPTKLDFGGVLVGTSAPPQSFTIKNTGNQAMQITTFALAGRNSSSFTVTTDMGGVPPKTPFSIPIGQSMTFSVTYRAQVADVEDAQVNIACDDTLHPSGSVALSGSGQQPNLKTLPLDMDTLDFGKIWVGTTTKAKVVRIENSGDATLKIKSVKVTGMMGGFAVDQPGPFTVEPGKPVSVQVTFTPLMDGDYAAILEIAPDHENLQPVTINLIGKGLMATVTAKPCYADPMDSSAPCKPGEPPMDFGKVPLNTPSMSMVVLIHNGATAPQPVTVAADPAQFSVDIPALTVPAGNDVKLSVRFTPDAVKMFTGKVTVSVPGSMTPLASVALKGEGLDDGTTPVDPNRMPPGSCTLGGRNPTGILLMLGLVLLGTVLRRRRR